MATPTNLSEYYAGQGKALPSLQDRSTVATQAGITGPYVGNVAQNNQLLSYLQKNPANVSTTTLSNTNKINQVPGIISTTENLAKTGINVDQNGTGTYANGTIVPSPVVPENVPTPTENKGKITNTGGYVGDTYYPPGATLPTGDDGKPLPTTETSPADDKINTNLNNLLAQSDALTASAVQGIQAQFAQLRQQQEQANKGQEAEVRNALLMGGVTGQGSNAQYAPISSTGIVSAQINYGIQQIADLNNKEMQAVNAARAAGQSNNFQLMSKINDNITKIRDEKVNAANELNNKIAEQNKKIADETLQVTKDNAVAELFSTGVTDPAKILAELKKSGVSITAEEVSKTLKNIAENNGTDVSRLSQDAQEFYRLKAEPNGLPVSILHLPSTAEQMAAFIRLKTNAETKKTTGGGGGTSTGGGTTVSTGGKQTYASDLDALVDNAINTIPTKFGQESFKSSISKARNDADKISTIATVVLKNSPGPIREDFINQTTGMKQLDKAISLIDTGVKTGIINATKQYVYNKAGKDFDPKLAAVNAHIIAAIQPYRNSVTGAAWGTQEENEYQQLFGSTKYSPTELKERLTRLKNIMKDKTTSALNAQVNPLGSGTDFFEETVSVGGSGPTDFLNSPIPGTSGTSYSPDVWGKSKI